MVIPSVDDRHEKVYETYDNDFNLEPEWLLLCIINFVIFALLLSMEQANTVLRFRSSVLTTVRSNQTDFSRAILHFLA